MAHKKLPQFVGILTTYVDDELTREDYEESCEISGITPGDDNAFEEWKREEADITWDDDMSNLESVLNDVDFVITGKVGRWDGSRTILPVRITGLKNAINKCISDCHNDVEVKLNTKTGIIEFYGHHHDATDCFEIHKLSKNGLKWWKEDDSAFLCNEHWFKKIGRHEIWG